MVAVVEEVAVMATPTYQATKVGAVSVCGLKLVQVVQQEQAQVVLMALKVASSYTIAEKGEIMSDIVIQLLSVLISAVVSVGAFSKMTNYRLKNIESRLD